MGRPKKALTEHYKKIIRILAQKGMIDREISTICGVTEPTFNRWKKDYPEWFEQLKADKDVANNKVKKALFDRAIGYEYTETKIITDYASDVEIKREVATKRMAPSVTAQIFWLKNRDPDNWNDKKDETNINVNVRNLSDSDLDKIIEDLTKAQ